MSNYRSDLSPLKTWFVGIVIAMCVSVPRAQANLNVRIPFTYTGNGHGGTPATIRLTDKPQRTLNISLSPRNIIFLNTIDEKSTPLSEFDMPCRLRRGSNELLLKQRDTELRVFLNDALLGKTEGTWLTGRPETKFTPGTGITLDGRARIQKVGTIAFADDFARVADSAPLWEMPAGKFALNTSRNPGSSQSAFQLWGGYPDGEAIAVANQSRWFWDDMLLGVSCRVPETPACWGLVFNYHDRANCHILRWSQGEENGLVDLVRRRDGNDIVIGGTRFAMAPGQWYRLSIAIYGSVVKVFIDGSKLLSASDNTLVGGQIGLYLRETPDAYFDDVTAETVGSEVLAEDWIPPEPFGPCEQQWSDFSKKSFYDDPFMTQWAHPRSFWESVEKSSGYRFRNRFFNDVTFCWEHAERQRLHWPDKPISIRLFADSATPDCGYEFSIAGSEIGLKRQGVEVTQGKLDAKNITAITASAIRGEISLTMNDRKLISWKDPDPILKGYVTADLGPVAGMHLKRPDWRDTVSLRSSHRLDYSFDHAPTAWQAQAGDWRGTHRWACVPKWSFFGGRGGPGPAEITNGAALLWNLRQFSGDFDIEISAAPMEGTPQRVHFSWPVTVNVAFCADGKNLDSGYFLRFGTYDTPTQLFRQGVELASWDRRIAPDMRLDPRPWYHHVTRVWQQLRIEKRSGHLTVSAAKHGDQAEYLGMERVFDFDDEAPPAGTQLGLWAWGANGLAVARAVVSFENSPGPAPPASPETPIKVLPGNGNGSARIIRRENTIPGGAFATPLATSPIDVDTRGYLQFDCRETGTSHLSVLAHVRGQTAEAIVFGPRLKREFTIPLEHASVQDVGEGWHHVTVDFRASLRDAFPDDKLTLASVHLGSPCSSLEENAGLGVNRAGDCYDITNLHWSTPPERSAEKVAQTVSPKRVYGRRIVTDFEHDLGECRRMGGIDGAALFRDPNPPGRAGHALRLLNQRVAGPAGAWIIQTPFQTRLFPELRFAYRFHRGAELNLYLQANGRDLEVRLTGQDSTFPVIGTPKEPIQRDEKWHTAHVPLHRLLQAQLGTSDITVNAVALADSWRMTTWQRRACWIDDITLVPDPAGIPAESNRPETKAQKTDMKILPAPRVSYIPSDRLERTVFEWAGASSEETAFGECAIRRAAWLLRCENDGATGTGCVEAVNLSPDGFYSVYLRKSAWDPERWPMVSFDYRFMQPNCALNLSLLVNEAMTIVEWTGPNPRRNYFSDSVIGQTETAQQDGMWHHTSFNLYNMLQAKRFPGENHAAIHAAELSTWATNHHGGGYLNPTGARLRIDNVTFFSNRGRDPAFEWKFPTISTVTSGYIYTFSRKSSSDHPKEIHTSETRVQFRDCSPGEWIFQVRAAAEDDIRAETAKHTIIIEE